MKVLRSIYFKRTYIGANLPWDQFLICLKSSNHIRFSCCLHYIQTWHFFGPTSAFFFRSQILYVSYFFYCWMSLCSMMVKFALIHLSISFTGRTSIHYPDGHNLGTDSVSSRIGSFNSIFPPYFNALNRTARTSKTSL